MAGSSSATLDGGRGGDGPDGGGGMGSTVYQQPGIVCYDAKWSHCPVGSNRLALSPTGGPEGALTLASQDTSPAPTGLWIVTAAEGAGRVKICPRQSSSYLTTSCF